MQIVFNCILQKKIPICVSEPILAEYRSVLSRNKFDRFLNFKDRADKLLNNLEKIAEFYEPKITLNVINDFADNRYLELAIEAKASYIITGNFNDFTFTEYNNTKIVSAKYFYENFCNV